MIQILAMWLFKPWVMRRRAKAYAIRMEALARVCVNGGNEPAAWAAIQRGNKAIEVFEDYSK